MADAPRNVKKVYNEGYARMKELAADPRLDVILSFLPSLDIPPKGTILDIGCGDGFFTLKMAKKLRTKDLYGIDISKKAVEYANKIGIKAQVLDIDEGDLPYKDNFFDFIFCGNLIELILNADHLLKELHRVLKPEGKIIMTFPNIASWASRISLLLGYLPFYSRVSTEYDLGKMIGGIKKGSSTGFIRLFTLHAFTQLAELHGLKVIKSQGTIEHTLPPLLQMVDRVIARKTSLAFHLICVLTKA